MSYLKSLPINGHKLWLLRAVYSPQVCPSEIYIGSSTNTTNSVSARRRRGYDSGAAIPRYVQKSLDGYVIVHKCHLCWTLLPSAAELPLLRHLFLALEAAFTFVLWAIYVKTGYGHGMTSMCRWAQSLHYDGLCSHNPLSEAPHGDCSLSAEQLESMAAGRAQKHRIAEKEASQRYKKRNHDQVLKSEKKYRDENSEKTKAAQEPAIERPLRRGNSTSPLTTTLLLRREIWTITLLQRSMLPRCS